jgi:type 1 glutamine amidotransferase
VAARVVAVVLAALVAALAASAPPAAAPPTRVLVFTKTGGYRHASIPAAIQAVRQLGTQASFAVDATEDATVFTDASLARYDVVAFVLTSGDILDPPQRSAFERYIRAGGGFVGVHSAADTERGWAWYGRLVGAWSSGHPEIQTATMDVATPRDESTTHLPARWTREDEWYSFLTAPRAAGVRVLLTLDETSYLPREFVMGADHPIAWSQAIDGGRAWYTAGGHTEGSYSEPLFLQHLLGGIRWAADTGGPPRTAPTPGAKKAPKVVSLKTAVRGRRIAVTLRHADCARCTARLRVRSRSVALEVTGKTARGLTPALPPGRWQLTVVVRDRSTGLSKTVRRFVRVR